MIKQGEKLCASVLIRVICGERKNSVRLCATLW